MTTAIENPTQTRKSRPSKATRAAAKNAAQTSSAPVDPAVDVNASAPAPAPVSESAGGRYAPAEVASSVADRVKAARTAGFSRSQLEALVAEAGGYMGGSALWRTEAGRVHADEVPYITEVLDKIDAKAVEPATRGGKTQVKEPSEADVKIQNALALLALRGEARKLAELKELLNDVAEALGEVPAEA